MKAELLSMSVAELREWMKSVGESAFRGGQVYEWLVKGADFAQMRNLSGPMREKLSGIAVANGFLFARIFDKYFAAAAAKSP